MLCEKCEGKTIVLDTRKYEDTQIRKRKCTKCNEIYITREVADVEAKDMYLEYLSISKMGYRDKKKGAI